MENQLNQRKKSLASKLPEILKSLEALAILKEKHEKGEDTEVDYELSDTVNAKAVIPVTEKANVMVEYTIQEAIDLLQSKKKTLENSLEQLDIDIGFLREQMTTLEVNVARVYNWQVIQSRKAKQ